MSTLGAVAAGRRVLTVTLNAAIDKRYVVDGVEPGTVMRVRECVASAGGKGLNVARAAVIAGAEVVATGFVAGHAGRFIAEGVEREQIRAAFVAVEGESRTCVNLYDSTTGRTSELLEPGPVVAEADLDRLTTTLAALADEADVVVMSGSAPRGAPAQVYVRLVEVCRAAGVPVLLDTSGPTLTAALVARPDLIKPNADEVATLAGGQGDPALFDDERVLAELGSRLVGHQGPGAGTVVISRGAAGAVLVADGVALRVAAPRVRAVNTVGCGDAQVAALALATAAGLDPASTLELGVAVASAAAMTAETGRFRPADVDRLLADVRATPVGVKTTRW